MIDASECFVTKISSSAYMLVELTFKFQVSFSVEEIWNVEWNAVWMSFADQVGDVWVHGHGIYALKYCWIIVDD
jgi:hypothetical protein